MLKIMNKFTLIIILTTFLNQFAVELEYGIASIINQRTYQQDRFSIPAQTNIRNYFGVFDGHGSNQNGHTVAEYLKNNLHTFLQESLDENINDPEFIKQNLIDGFKYAHEQIEGYNKEGSTAVVALIKDDKIYIANSGDSRAVLSKDGKAVALSEDHKPYRSDERERIIKAGGYVVFAHGCQRVSKDNNDGIAVSRGIGDKAMSPLMIPDPEIKVIDIIQDFEFIILASDGFWDTVSNDDAVKYAKNYLKSGVSLNNTADKLAHLARTAGSKDNITVLIIDLRKLSNQKAGFLSSSLISKENLEQIREKSFFENCKKFAHQLSTKKTFIGILFIALTIFKGNNTKAFLMAIKSYLILRSLEYCIIKINSPKLGNINFLSYVGESPRQALSTRVKSLQGTVYKLNLDDIEHFSRKTFGELIEEAETSQEPFMIAAVKYHQSATKEYKHTYLNVKSMVENLLDFNQGNRLFMHNIIGLDNDQNCFSLQLIFTPMHRSRVEEIHYFELPDHSSNELEYLGSQYQIQECFDFDSTKKLMSKIIMVMSDMQIRFHLTALKMRLEKPDAFAKWFGPNKINRKKNLIKTLMFLDCIIEKIRQLYAKNIQSVDINYNLNLAESLKQKLNTIS
ncbi:MAG: PP2C family protein-serine/threonine phosphatase [Candidatus Babeliales bacterium]|nr:PP2C family protein-serine/threonine phosphatase [Candidatus Babeliales bacterium]